MKKVVGRAKKVINKLRLWLIDKLGGTYQVVKVVYKYEKPVLLQAKISISERELLLRDLGEHYVKQELSKLLAQEIMNSDLVIVDRRRDYETSSIVFRARIAVVKGGD